MLFSLEGLGERNNTAPSEGPHVTHRQTTCSSRDASTNYPSRKVPGLRVLTQELSIVKTKTQHNITHTGCGGRERMWCDCAGTPAKHHTYHTSHTQTMMEGRAGRRLMRALMHVTAPTPSRSGTRHTCARTTIGSSSARLSFGALSTRCVGISRET